ncbi:MAG: hypothetical protein AAF478_00400 [Pseudomonadota bacterium]
MTDTMEQLANDPDAEATVSRYDPKLHHRRAGHLKHMTRSPSNTIKFAARAMIDAMNKSPENNVFKELEFDFRAAGYREIANAIEDLAEVLDEVIGRPKLPR